MGINEMNSIPQVIEEFVKNKVKNKDKLFNENTNGK
jgi:hypothetical protein